MTDLNNTSKIEAKCMIKIAQMAGWEVKAFKNLNL